MFDFIKKLKTLNKDITEFYASDKSKLISVSINIACLFTILVISMLVQNSIQKLGLDGLELVVTNLLDILIVTLEVLLCLQVVSYVFNKSEQIKLHLPYALVVSIVINLLIELYEILKLLDIKSSIASFSVTTHTLTTVNIHIVLMIFVVICNLGLGVYVYQRYFNSKITRGK